jgi:hypothetical protein
MYKLGFVKSYCFKYFFTLTFLLSILKSRAVKEFNELKKKIFAEN